MTTIEEIVAVLVASRFAAAPEVELQNAIALALGEAGIAFEREVVLGPGDRIDFLVGDVGIEVKVDGSLSDVTRCLHRYLGSERVSAVVLATTRFRHRAVPREMQGKVIAFVHVGAWM
jgi:hypothetical protein